MNHTGLVLWQGSLHLKKYLKVDESPKWTPGCNLQSFHCHNLESDKKLEKLTRMSDREDSGEEFTEFADLSSKAAADFDLSLTQYDQSQISYSDTRPIQYTTLLLTFN